MKNELTTTEAAEYAKLDEIVSNGAKTFMSVGMALITIHEKRLYRGQCDTFEKYIESRDISRQYAYRIIKQAKTALHLKDVTHRLHSSDMENIEEIERASGKVLEELQKYPAEKHGEIWRIANSDGKATVRKIQLVAAVVSHETPPEPKERKKKSVATEPVDVYAEVEKEKTDAAAETLDNRISAVIPTMNQIPAQSFTETENLMKPMQIEHIPLPDADLTEKDQIHVNAQAIQDMATEHGIIKDILEGLSEALGFPPDDYEALVDAIDALKEKTPDSALEDVAAALGCQPQQQVIIKCITELKSQTNALVIKMNDFGPEPKTVALTPKLYERKLAALDLGAEEAAKGDEQERKKYGVIANRSAQAFMNPKTKLAYNPYV